MLLESIVVDDVVNRTATKLHALVLSPSSTNIVADLAVFRRRQSASEFPPSNMSSSLHSSSSCSRKTHPDAHDPDHSVDVAYFILHDMIESICHPDRRRLYCSPIQVKCSSNCSASPDSDDVDQLGQGTGECIDEQIQNGPHSSAIATMPFELLGGGNHGIQLPSCDCLDDDEENADLSLVNLEGLDSELRHSKSDPECEIIEIDLNCPAYRSRYEYLDSNEFWDISLDISAFKSDPSSSDFYAEEVYPADSKIHFYQPQDFTPADLLPLYEPDVPIEFCYPALQFRDRRIFTVDNVSDLETLQSDAFHDVHAPAQSPLWRSENESVPLDIGSDTFDVQVSTPDESRLRRPRTPSLSDCYRISNRPRRTKTPSAITILRKRLANLSLSGST